MDRRDPLAPRHFAAVVTAVVTALAGCLAVVLPTSARAAGSEAGDAIDPALLDTVIVVDESGSLTDADLAREREAVSIIASGALNPSSRVTVIGFGSDNGQQSPVDEVCPPTVVDTPAGRASLEKCVGALRIRTAAEGNDTDHASALAQALSYFSQGGPQGSLKTVFMLTDGNLDVARSPKYGSVPANRNQNAAIVLDEQLARARSLGVQVWPLGFGAQIDGARLEEMAAGGDQSTCAGDASKPRARVVASSADVTSSLLEAFSSRWCALSSPVEHPSVPGKVTVRVPTVATDGAIVVAKGDPRIQVGYLDPEGRSVPSDGTLGDSTFARSGQGLPTESLRIVNPLPGDWTVEVKAPAGVPVDGRVSVLALWQGAVRASIFPEPPTVRTGEPVVVRVTLSTRTGPVTSAEALKGLSVQVTGTTSTQTGRSVPFPVEVGDDGRAPDTKAGDGIWSGQLTAPEQSGDIRLEGKVNGAGVYAQSLPATVTVSAPSQLVVAGFVLDVPDPVITGTTLTGRVSASNGTSGPVPVRLELVDDEGLVRLDTPPEFELPPGDSDRRFSLSAPAGGRTGQLAAHLRLVKAADPGVVIGSSELRTEVAGPPSWVSRHRWYVVGAGLLLVAALIWLVLRLRARRRAADVSGLVVDLVSLESGQKVFSLNASSRWSPVLRCYLSDESDRPGAARRSRLSYLDGGDAVRLEIRREVGSRARIDGPAGLSGTVLVGDRDDVLEVTGALGVRVREKHRNVPSREGAEEATVAWPDADPLLGADDEADGANDRVDDRVDDGAGDAPGPAGGQARQEARQEAGARLDDDPWF